MWVNLEIRNQSICLFFLSLLFIYLFIHLFIYVFMYLFIYLFIHWLIDWLIDCNFPALEFVQHQDLRLAVDSFGQLSSVMLCITSGAPSFISFPHIPVKFYRSTSFGMTTWCYRDNSPLVRKIRYRVTCSSNRQFYSIGKLGPNGDKSRVGHGGQVKISWSRSGVYP